jgi:hypothetical protein
LNRDRHQECLLSLGAYRAHIIGTESVIRNRECGKVQKSIGLLAVHS